MKKLIALLLSIILVLTLSGVSVIAATDDNQISINDALANDILKVDLSSASAASHGEVTLELTLGSNPGFSVMILDLDHSSEAITLKSATVNASSGLSLEYSNQKGGSTLAFYHLGSDCTYTGALATLTFTVGAYSGVADIVLSAEEGNVCDANGNIVEPVLTNGMITVSCSHTYVFKDRVEPSCSKTGAINYECTICGAVSTTPIDKAPHSYSSEKVVVLEPDCDTEGKKAYKCEFCGDFKDEETIAPLGHKYINADEYVITLEPTCTVPGSKYRDCYVCNNREVTEIPVLGHDEGTWRTTNPGDCTTDGVVSRYCNRCDGVLETKVKEKGQHVMGWAVTEAPTCSKEGTEQYMCIICGGEKGETRKLDKLSHVHGEEVVTKQPTCKDKGVTTVYCKVCNEVVATKDIETVPHVKNSLTVITAPTNEAEGEGQYKCKECGEILETVTLPKTFGEIYAENTVASLGNKVAVKVFIKNNPGFSAGIVRIKYDETSLIYNGIENGEITDDITAGASKIGEITVLISLSDAQYSANGLVFTINFTLTADATDGTVELSYDPQNDFADREGERIFFNMKSGEIEIVTSIPGDANGDGNVDTTDLAAMKLYLAGATNEIAPGVDADGSGVIDTGDLATLKLILAGLL